jgi:hypothetical protein
VLRYNFKKKVLFMAGNSPGRRKVAPFSHTHSMAILPTDTVVAAPSDPGAGDD